MAYQSGIWAKYYNYNLSQTLTKSFFDNLPTPLAERAESIIDHGDGTTGSPQFSYPQSFSLDNDYGAIVFNGNIKAPITGTVRLYMQVADDEWAGLFLNGSTTETLEKPDHVNNPNEVWVDVQMVQNEYIPFVLKYVEFSGNNLTKLSWSYAGQTKEVIPASAYYTEIAQLIINVNENLTNGINPTPINLYDEYTPFTCQSDNASAFEIYKNGELLITLEEYESAEYNVVEEGFYSAKAIWGDTFADSDLSIEVEYFIMPAPTAVFNKIIFANANDTITATVTRTKNSATSARMSVFKDNEWFDIGNANFNTNGIALFDIGSNNAVGKSLRFQQVQGGIPNMPVLSQVFTNFTIAPQTPQPLPSVGLDTPIPAWNDQQGDLRAILMGHSPQPFYDLWFDYGYIMEVYKNDQLYLKYDITDGDTASSTGVYTTELLNNAGSTGSAGKKHDDGSFLFTAGAGDYGTYKFRLQKRTGNFEEYSGYSANFVYSAPVLAVSADPIVTSPSPYYVGTAINGTGVPGASIQVYIVGGKGDNLETTVTVAPNGTWSYTPIVEGDYKFGQYESGKDESNRIPLTVSSVSALPIVTTPSPTLTEQTINGTGVAGSWIKVYKDNTFAFQVQVNSNGAWSITPQVSGSYKFSQEESGKPESAQTTASVVNQSQSPVPTILSTSPFYTNALIAGQAIYDTVVKVYREGIYLETLPPQASDGSFGFVPTQTGSYQFTRTDVDRTESAKTTAILVTVEVVTRPPTASKKTLIISATETCQNTLQFAIGSALETDPNNIAESAWQDSNIFTGLNSGIVVSQFGRVKTNPSVRAFFGTKTI
jgi:hypothetical protein